jgi:hypothetical protein
MKTVHLVLILLLSSTSFAKKKDKEYKYEPKQTNESVKDRDLDGVVIKSTSIVKESAFYYNPQERNFVGPTLGYITPWNDKGYAFATLFKDKVHLRILKNADIQFDYFSPCWYLIRPGLEFVGDHEVNQTWMASVKPAKVLPRFLFDGWNQSELPVSPFLTLSRSLCKLFFQ